MKGRIADIVLVISAQLSVIGGFGVFAGSGVEAFMLSLPDSLPGLLRLRDAANNSANSGRATLKV